MNSTRRNVRRAVFALVSIALAVAIGHYIVTEGRQAALYSVATEIGRFSKANLRLPESAEEFCRWSLARESDAVPADDQVRDCAVRLRGDIRFLWLESTSLPERQRLLFVDLVGEGDPELIQGLNLHIFLELPEGVREEFSQLRGISVADLYAAYKETADGMIKKGVP